MRGEDMQKVLEKMKKYGVGSSLIIVSLLVTGLPATAQAGNEQEGQKIFHDKCVRCHAEDGSGNAVIGKALGAADLRSADVQKKSDADFYTQIEKGKGNMPPFGPSLDKSQINALVAYVRAFGKNQAAKKKK
jgi:mono/diheme cytochrome c family protein